MTKFGEYIHSLFMPSNLNLVKVKPLRGTALFVLNPKLVYSIVDSFFGGDGRFHTKIEGRDFTSTEMQVIQNVLYKIFDDLKEASAIFHYQNGVWGTGGRALFNMTPVDALERLQHQYQTVENSSSPN